MNLIKLRSELLLFIIAAYLILNHGFMMLRIPPTAASGLPLGETLIICFAGTLIFELKRLPSFSYVAPLTPLLFWWMLAFVQIALGLPKYGFWAIRDASHAIESAFIWVGFVIAAAPGFFDRFSRWLRAVLNIGAIYSLLYPFRETLENFSPKVEAAAGYTAPVLFNFFSASLVPLTAATRWLVDRVSMFGIPAVALAGGMIIYSMVMFQMRTTYMQIIAIFIILSFIQPRVAVKMTLGMFFGLAALAVLLASGLEITGRLGEKFTLDFLFQHFSAIWGASGEGMIYDAAQGVSQRFRWWANLWRDVTGDARSFLFGLGYGMPLTDFYGADDVITREPHNSLISVMSRMGFVGLSFFVWFHLALVFVWLRAFRWCVRNGALVWKNNLLIMGVFFILMWVFSLGEDAFEKPYNAIVYYFLWGVVLRTYFEMVAPQGRLRREYTSGEHDLHQANPVKTSSY